MARSGRDGDSVRNSMLRSRFWVEAAFAFVTGVLFVVTFFWHDWLETFGFDPDNHDGSAEWVIIAVLALCTVSFGLAARLEWRRAAPATS